MGQRFVTVLLTSNVLTFFDLKYQYHICALIYMFLHWGRISPTPCPTGETYVYPISTYGTNDEIKSTSLIFQVRRMAPFPPMSWFKTKPHLLLHRGWYSVHESSLKISSETLAGTECHGLAIHRR